MLIVVFLISSRSGVPTWHIIHTTVTSAPTWEKAAACRSYEAGANGLWGLKECNAPHMARQLSRQPSKSTLAAEL